MLEILQQQFRATMPLEEKVNRVREFLQIITLKAMYDKGLFDNLAFVGGTALRVLYNLKRFSEDLDFSLINKKDYDFKRLNKEIVNSLMLFGLHVDSKINTKTNVHSSFLKFEGLLKSLGLSQLQSQKLSVKIEIDTNPAAGWKTENTIVNKTYMFNVAHFDLPSLFATKLHACFYRKFTKGRDFYDLVWYILHKIKPNYLLLNNAIMQTTKNNPMITESKFKEFFVDKIKKIDFAEVRKDVERFLEDKNELRLIDKGLILETVDNVFI